MNWQKNLKVKYSYPLKDRTTFKIGGPAEFFCAPKDLNMLRRLIVQAKKKKIPIFILGAGSNLLISDRGIKGIVVSLDSDYFKKIRLSGNLVEAGGGITIPFLIKFALKKSLSGIEFLSGIPGTLGGAIMMNAGCWGKDISGLLSEIKVMDYNGRVKRLKRGSIKFGYRKSALAKYIILGATLRLNKDNRKDIIRNIKNYLLKRRNTQGLTFYSAGCIFKNPKNNYAARLIELCGLKGKEIGSAVVSRKHANFILNKKDAKAVDVLSLMKLIRDKVKKEFGLSLRPEIRILK